MHVAKWGNSLAVRLPAALVEELGLKAGDEIELRPAGDRKLDVVPDPRMVEAMAAIEALSRAFPEDYRFDRDEANAR